MIITDAGLRNHQVLYKNRILLRRPDELPMAKLMFNSVEEKKDAEIKIRTRELNVEGQFPLTIKYMSLKPKNSPLLKGKVVGNQLLVKNVFFDFSNSQEQAESEVRYKVSSDARSLLERCGEDILIVKPLFIGQNHPDPLYCFVILRC